MNILYYEEYDMRLPMLLDEDHEIDEFISIKKDNHLAKEKKIDIYLSAAHEMSSKFFRITVGAEITF